MIITIRNLTSEAIKAETCAVPSKLNVVRQTACCNAVPDLEKSSTKEIILLPSVNITTNLAKGFQREIILQHSPDVSQDLSSSTVTEKQGLLDHRKWHIHPGSFKVRFSMTLAASWQAVPTPENCPWRLFSRRVSRRHHKLLILKRRHLGSFLSEMPDGLPLSSLALPGTHDTMAFHGWPISQCQSPSSPLSTQLLGGIRVLDIRLAVIPPPTPISSGDVQHELIAYHGLWPQKTPFTSILNDIHAFLTSPIGLKETIVMSIKQEDFIVTPAPIFSRLVRETIVRGAGGWDDSELTGGQSVNKGMWFLENRIPKLGEVRGKVVMLSRFGGNGHGWEGGLEGMGIHPTTWPDSEKRGFEWELKGTLVRTHDWYAIPSFFSIPEKVHLGTQNLILPSSSRKPMLPITYFSAASFPLAFPPTIAKGFGWPKWGLGVEGVNSRLGAWLLDQLGGDGASCCSDDTNRMLSEKQREVCSNAEPRIRGWTFLDYYSEPEGGDLVPLLIECNFRGRTMGEEGW